MVIALGFYGTRLKIHCGSISGFEPFGPERKVTRSENNILYELDGEPAFGLYKKYLGDRLQDLPTQCFYFPLYYKTSKMKKGIVRTILGMDEKTESMTFAGDLEQGGRTSHENQYRQPGPRCRRSRQSMPERRSRLPRCGNSHELYWEKNYHETTGGRGN